MNPSPLDLALKEITETKHLLDTLIHSSESFDYPKAKAALKELQKKQRELAKLQAELTQQKKLTQTTPAQPNITFVSFRAAAS